MTMTSKNFKTALFAAAIVALIVPIALQNNAHSASDALSEVKLKQQMLNEQTTKYFDLVDQNQNLRKQADDQPNPISKSLIESKIKDNEVEINKTKQTMSEIRQNIQSYFTMSPAKVTKYREGQQILEKSDIPWYQLQVNELTQKLTINMLPEHQNKGFEKKISQLIGPDIDFEIKYAEDDYQDWTCTNQQTADCDPLVGGIRINKDLGIGCTLSLPVKQGTAWGFLTAAHCYLVGQNIYQPTSAYGKIGEVQTGDRVFGGSCDCVFITKTGSETALKSVWLASNTYTSIVSTPTLSSGNSAMMQGQVSGADWGTVTATGATRTIGTTTFTNLVIFSGLVGAVGDSGAPLIEPVGGAYYGLLKGGDSTEQLVIPWSSMVTNLSVSLP